MLTHRAVWPEVVGLETHANPPGQLKWHRAAGIPRMKVEAHSHRVARGLHGAHRFVELIARFDTHPERCARRRGEHAVTRAIGVMTRLETMPCLLKRAVRTHQGDPIPGRIHLDPAHRRVQEQIERPLVAGETFKLKVPTLGAPRRVALQVVEEQFLDETRFAGVGEVALSRPHRRNPDLGAGVATEDGAVLDKRDAQPGPGRGDRRAKSGKAAADDDEIMMVMECFQGMKVAGSGRSIAAGHPDPKGSHDAPRRGEQGPQADATAPAR